MGFQYTGPDSLTFWKCFPSASDHVYYDCYVLQDRENRNSLLCEKFIVAVKRPPESTEGGGMAEKTRSPQSISPILRTADNKVCKARTGLSGKG